jgi:UDP-glucose/GDP-mannose dehydrogenase family, UDP binding domain
VRAYDPEGMKQARAVLENVTYAEHAYACMDGADALVIATEWDEFRALDLARVRSLLKRPILVDLRNIYRREDMDRFGLAYVCVGRAGAVGSIGHSDFDHLEHATGGDDQQAVLSSGWQTQVRSNTGV